MKYVLFDSGSLPTIRIFDEMTKHSDVGREVGLKVISAGKIYFNPEISVINGSVSLNVSYSKEQTKQDKETIERLIKLTA